jgi:hypothetical protein
LLDAVLFFRRTEFGEPIMNIDRHVLQRPRLLALALAGCLAVTATPLLAQSTGATLRGQATAGTEIVVTNADTGLVRRATATSEGSYAIAGLPPAPTACRRAAPRPSPSCSASRRRQR